ncbi:MAG: LPS biosynthesis protein WbpP, partial [Acidimicrobiia bacterium]
LAGTADNAAGNVLNIGTGNQVVIKRLWELIASLSGCGSAPCYAPARSGDILQSVAGMEATRAMLDFRNDYSLEDGLKLTLDGYIGQGAKS